MMVVFLVPCAFALVGKEGVLFRVSIFSLILAIGFVFFCRGFQNMMD